MHTINLNRLIWTIKMTTAICRKLKQENNLDFVSVYFWQFYINELA